MGSRRVGQARIKSLINENQNTLKLNTTAQMTAGTGITTGTGTLIKYSVLTVGNIIHTTILVDLTGLSVDASDDVIIGVASASNCHIGEITDAVNGTVIGGRITCLEAPAGASADINLWTANISNGPEGATITDADTTSELLDHGEAWTVAGGAATAMTLSTSPATATWLYLTNGAASGAGTYTGGRFLIQFWGYEA